MSFERGQLIGNYEIVGRLGAGAMGEVFRARDQRLGRDVALKVLQFDVANNPDRRARFEKEARVVAGLNHPNIVGLYDIGEHAGQFFLAGELIEGKTLRERMNAGPIGVKELYRLAVQLASGMAAAHAAGVVHRDLKPDNVMVTNDGRLKILDFGLARQGGSSPGADSTATATMAIGSTQPGTVMGTATYMSPEQARGEAVDHRSDQFSFGVMLYEMVTGVSPFLRETAVQTMAAVLTDEPKRIEASVPTPLRWTISRCMEKDAAGRYESTADLARELHGQQEHLSEVFVSGLEQSAPTASPQAKRNLGWVWGLVAGISLAGLGAYALFNRPAPQMKYTPMEVTWTNPSPGYWAPDGKGFTYSAEVSGNRQVFLRYLDAPMPVQLTKGTVGVAAEGWLPDSKRVVISGRSPDGKLPALYSVPVTGGEPEWILTLDKNTATAQLSGDGKSLAVLKRLPSGGTELYIASPITAPLQKYEPWPMQDKVFFNNLDLRFAPDGKSLWLWWDPVSGRQLWKLPLPIGSGQPRRMLESNMSVYGSTPRLSLFPDSRHGVVSISEKAEDAESQLWTIDVESGRREPLTQGIYGGVGPELSPDGSRLLYLNVSAEFRLVSMSLENGSTENVISSNRMVGMPAWAMAQDKFAYVSARNGVPAIWVRENGADRPVVTASAFPPNTMKWLMTPALSPDGGRVIYARIGLDNKNTNWISSLNGGPAVKLTASGPEVSEYGGAWSPDGSRFVFQQVVDGKLTLVVAKTNGDSAVTRLRDQIANRIPEWSPDGKWIRIQDPNKGWMLISPDGKEEKELGGVSAIEMAFSKDSTRLYGIRNQNGRLSLFSLDIASKAVKEIDEINSDLRPSSPLNPGIRLSLSPDGKRILYPVTKLQSSLWMIEGFRRPGWF